MIKVIDLNHWYPVSYCKKFLLLQNLVLPVTKFNFLCFKEVSFTAKSCLTCYKNNFSDPKLDFICSKTAWVNVTLKRINSETFSVKKGYLMGWLPLYLIIYIYKRVRLLTHSPWPWQFYEGLGFEFWYTDWFIDPDPL